MTTAATQHEQSNPTEATLLGIGKSNGLFYRPRPPTPGHPAAILPAAARAWGRPVRPAPA
jgi:hypothetical protein